MSPKSRRWDKEYIREYYLENKERIIKNNTEYAKRNRKKINTYARQWKLKRKILVLTHYGNGKLACVLCGYSDIRALSLDHINNDGAEQRKKYGATVKYYGWLIRNNFPSGHQTLCMNCQWEKR